MTGMSPRLRKISATWFRNSQKLTYAAEYLPCQVLFENSNGKSGYFHLFLGFGRPPSLDSKKTGRIKNELALVSQIGSDIIFASHQNIVANFYAILREVRRLGRSFLVFTTSKMPPRVECNTAAESPIKN